MLSGELITSYTHELIAKRNVWPWFDRVDTHANPVDGLSRGRFEGDWLFAKLRFPQALKERLVAYLEEPAPLMKVTRSSTSSTWG